MPGFHGEWNGISNIWTHLWGTENSVLDFMALIDLMEACLYVLPTVSEFFRFSCLRKHFKFSALPFALISPPRVLTELMTVTILYLIFFLVGHSSLVFIHNTFQVFAARICKLCILYRNKWKHIPPPFSPLFVHHRIPFQSVDIKLYLPVKTWILKTIVWAISAALRKKCFLYPSSRPILEVELILQDYDWKRCILSSSLIPWLVRTLH